MPACGGGPPVLVNTCVLSDVLAVRLGGGGGLPGAWVDPGMTWILVAFHLNGMLALKAASTRTRS
jgi:hypothetical protein